MLDLSRERGLAELVSTTLEVWTSRFAVLVSMTAVVVVPTLLLVDGVWGRQLAHGAHAHAPLGASIASNALGFVVLPALVGALHVRVVEALGRGETPSVGQAMGEAAPRLGAACLALLLATVAMFAGYLCLIVPGVWLTVSLYFSTQAAVAEGLPPRLALERSQALVRGRWWSTAGIGLVLAVMGAAIGVPAGIVARAVGTGAGYTVIAIAGQVLVLSFTALSSTLFYFSLRATRPPDILRA